MDRQTETTVTEQQITEVEVTTLQTTEAQDAGNADGLWVGMMLNGEARWAVARTTGVVEEARRRHQASPVATAALGRTMTGALLLGSSLKAEENLTIRVLGDGPLGGIVVVSNPQGEVKGYVQNAQVDLPLRSDGKLDVRTAVGTGELIVTRSLPGGQNYTGRVPLNSGEIAEDFVYYLLHSEQVPSAMVLGVLMDTDRHVSGSAGLLIQLMPNASEETVQAIEDNLAKLQIGISELASLDMTFEVFVKFLLGDLPYTVLDKRPVSFRCHCSKDRLNATLKMLGKEELTELIGQGQAEVVCHFCNEHYNFSRSELEELVQDLENKD